MAASIIWSSTPCISDSIDASDSLASLDRTPAGVGSVAPTVQDGVRDRLRQSVAFGEPLVGRKATRRPRDDPSTLLALAVTSASRPIGVGMCSSRQLTPEPVFDPEERLDDEVRQVVDRMDSNSPRFPVDHHVHAITVTGRKKRCPTGR